MHDDHPAPSSDAAPAAVDRLLDRLVLRLAEVRGSGDRAASAHRVPMTDDSLAEMLFGGLLEAAPDGMIISDPAGVIRLANSEAERLLGWGPGELVGQPIEILLPQALRQRHSGHRGRFLAHPTTRRMGIGLELVACRKDGSEIPVEISLSMVDTAHGRFVTSALRDVSDRRQTEALLKRQAEALARSNEALQQFAYVASHDLQEPLRMVSSYLQLLERRYSGKLDEDAREFIGFAVDGAKRMQALINDLLAFARIGRGDVVRARVDLGEILSRVVRDLEVAVRESGGRVEVGRLPTVTGDPTQLVQLFQNLVGNAIKFQRPGVAPEVVVAATREHDGWTISVADNGIGIEPQYRDRIFQIFQRLHTRQEYPGTGIGLAICKRIVEQHGGDIRVEATPGSGSTFLVTFPDRSPS